MSRMHGMAWRGSPSLPSVEPPRPSARRRLSKHGNSWMVAIPKALLLELRLTPGDVLEVIYYHEHDGFFVRPIWRRADQAAPPALATPTTSAP